MNLLVYGSMKRSRSSKRRSSSNIIIIIIIQHPDIATGSDALPFHGLCDLGSLNLWMFFFSGGGAILGRGDLDCEDPDCGDAGPRDERRRKERNRSPSPYMDASASGCRCRGGESGPLVRVMRGLGG